MLTGPGIGQTTGVRAGASPLRAATSQAWQVMVGSFFIAFMTSSTWMSFGVFFKPILQEFGWDRATLSLAVAIQMIVYGTSQPLIGRAVDRWGARRIIFLGACLAGGGALLLSFVQSVWQLYLIHGVVVSVGITCSSPVTHGVLISNWFRARRGFALGVASAGGTGGGLILIPLLNALILSVGWRQAYLLLGTAILLIALPIILVIIRSTPADRGLLPYSGPAGAGETQDGRGRARVLPAGEPAAVAGLGPPVASDELRGAMRTRPFWLLAGGFFVCGFTWQLVITHLVPFATDLGLSPTQAASAMGLVAGANFLGSLSMGALSDRVGRRGPLAAMYFLRGTGFLLLLLAPYGPTVFIFAVLAGSTLLATVPLTAAISGNLYGLRNLGAIFGTLTLIHHIGASLSVYAAGAIYDAFGSYSAMFLVGGLLGLAAGVLSSRVREPRTLP
ncbi:MAG: MFS transporter [Deltaproteobacteria bacterium]|nr:MFS transporter [Deltaproteobacteria bacterium]